MEYLLERHESPRSIINHKTAICNFFNWLCDEGHLNTNPASGIKKRRLPKERRKEIEFLQLPVVRKYLRACERYDPELVAHEIVQFFAGVRSDDEMNNFVAEWVKPTTREVVVPAEAAKMERREVIGNLEDIFWVWWQAYGREAGRLRPKYHQRRWRRIRILASVEDQPEADRLARLSVRTLLAQPLARSALGSWPWNARRRTFCTYHVAKNQSADKTALILRHRGAAATLHDSYRGTGITQRQGVRIF